MIRLMTSLLMLCALARTAIAEPKPAGSEQPYQLVRTLQLLQDQIARGSIEAHGAQLALLAHIGERLLTIEPTVWNDPRNARAPIVFMLSGGQPQVVRSLLDRGHVSREDKLLLGALAYVEGREREAAVAFRDVDARTLPATVGGHVALVQSALVIRQDLRAAIAHLDDARLLMPGTLVEEAALRREIFVAGQFDDFDKFEFLAIQYIRRYRESVYAGNFRQRFALALTRFSFAQNPAYFPRLAKMLEHLDVNSRRTLYLLISRTAVVRGRPAMAQLAADEAAALASDGSEERERARLYRASARVVTDGYDKGIAELRDISRAKLAPRDVELLDAALSLAGHMRKAAPAPDPIADDQSPPPAPPAPPRLDIKSSAEALTRAQKMLGDLDVLLKETKR